MLTIYMLSRPPVSFVTRSSRLFGKRPSVALWLCVFFIRYVFFQFLTRFPMTFISIDIPSDVHIPRNILHSVRSHKELIVACASSHRARDCMHAIAVGLSMYMHHQRELIDSHTPSQGAHQCTYTPMESVLMHVCSCGKVTRRCAVMHCSSGEPDVCSRTQV